MKWFISVRLEGREVRNSVILRLGQKELVEEETEVDSVLFE